MNIVAVAGIGLIAAILSVVIKQYKPEFSFYISMLTGIIIFIAVVEVLKPIFDSITSLISTVNIQQSYGEVLLKALAICYITQIASDSCKDAGESAIASKLELAGKVAIIYISLPLFNSLVEMVTKLLSS